jgi:hypothetical protein
MSFEEFFKEVKNAKDIIRKEFYKYFRKWE